MRGVDLWRRLTFELEQLTAVGYVSGDRMVCSSFGRHDSASAGIPMGPVTHRTRSGALVRTAVQIELTPGMTFLASTHEATGYTVLVHRDTSMIPRGWKRLAALQGQSLSTTGISLPSGYRPGTRSPPMRPWRSRASKPRCGKP